MRLVVNLILGFIAYHRLLWEPGWRGATREVEDWFFIPSYTSSLPVILICAWLLYRRRQRLRRLACGGGPAWLVAGLFLGGGALFLWAHYTRAYDLLAVSLMLNGAGCAVLYRGMPGLSAALLPIATLVFALPVPAPLLSEVVWRLQLWTAEYTGWLLLALGTPADVSGDLIRRAGQTFEVIETCSGLRSMEILTLLAVLMADLFGRGRFHGLLLVAAAPCVAFAMNGLRVVTLILNPESEALAVHNLQGVLVLLGGLLILYAYDGLLGWLLGLLRRRVPEREASDVPSPAAAGGGRRSHYALATLLAILAAASFWMTPWDEPTEAPRIWLSEQIPLEMGPWQGADAKSDLVFRGRVDWFDQIHRVYWSEGRPGEGTEPIDLFMGLGSHQRRLFTPLSPKNAYPGAGWVVEEEGVTTLEPHGLEVNWRVLRERSRFLLVYFWYEGHKGFGQEVVRSLLGLDTSPFQRDRRVLFYRMSTELRALTDLERKRAGRHLWLFYEALHARMQAPSVS